MLSFQIKKWDGAVCALVLLAALVLAAGLRLQARGREATVVISREGRVLYEDRLEGPDREIPVDGDYPMTVVIRQGQVWVEQSSCPGGDCREMGKISAPGQSIACLPNRVTVAVRGDSPVDLVVG